MSPYMALAIFLDVDNPTLSLFSSLESKNKDSDKDKKGSKTLY